MAMITMPPDNQAIRELRDELKDLNKSLKESSKIAERLTFGMFALSIVQLLVAVLQFILSFAFSNDIRTVVWGSVMVIITGVIIFCLAKKIYGEKLKK